METQEHPHHNKKEVNNFYLFVFIISFSIIVLQPLSMLTVMLLAASL